MPRWFEILLTRVIECWHLLTDAYLKYCIFGSDIASTSTIRRHQKHKRVLMYNMYAPHKKTHTQIQRHTVAKMLCLRGRFFWSVTHLGADACVCVCTRIIHAHAHAHDSHVKSARNAWLYMFCEEWQGAASNCAARNIGPRRGIVRSAFPRQCQHHFNNLFSVATTAGAECISTRNVEWLPSTHPPTTKNNNINIHQIAAGPAIATCAMPSWFRADCDVWSRCAVCPDPLCSNSPCAGFTRTWKRVWHVSCNIIFADNI